MQAKRRETQHAAILADQIGGTDSLMHIRLGSGDSCWQIVSQRQFGGQGRRQRTACAVGGDGIREAGLRKAMDRDAVIQHINGGISGAMPPRHQHRATELFPQRARKLFGAIHIGGAGGGGRPEPHIPAPGAQTPRLLAR